MPTRRDARVPLLLGHFGGGNAGDEAILDGTGHLLDAAGVTRVRVVARGTGYRPRLGARCRVDLVPPSPIAVVRATLDASAVVLCGGTHFYDDIPVRRRLWHYRYLARYLLVLGLARALGRPVLALGQGIGPLRHPTGRAITRTLFRLAPAGTVRDDASLACARRNRAPRGWTRTIDTAFARPLVAPASIPTRRALAIAPLFGARDAGTGVGDLAPLWDALVGAVSDAWPDLDLDRIEVLAVRAGDREADTALAAALAERLGAVAPVSTPTFTGDLDALGADLAAAAIVVCGRYHAFVLALLAGCVPIVLPTHRKLFDTAELLELPDALVVREATPGAIAKALVAAAEVDADDLAPHLDELRRTLARDRALLTRIAAGPSTNRRAR